MKHSCIKYYISDDNTIYDKKTINCKVIEVKSCIKTRACPVCRELFNTKYKLWIHKPLQCNKDKVNDVYLYDDFTDIFDILFHNNHELITEKYIRDCIGHITSRAYKELIDLCKGKIKFDDIYKPLIFSNISLNLTNTLSTKHKKGNGIFFSHPKIVKQTIHEIRKYNISVKNILEPSCGSCEFITHVTTSYPNASIDGVEYDETIYNTIKHFSENKVTIYNKDFLTFHTDKMYDLIIGNPPYFVIKKNDSPKKYHKYLEGRPNIYLIFILQCLEILSENGILAFILPNNFLNCSYYQKVRNHIDENFTILNIIDCKNGFIDTDQPTHIIFIQNKKPVNNTRFTLKITNNIIFNTEDKINQLKSLYKNSHTLDNLGFHVSVGKVVWNQVKDILTTDNTKTLLIYSSDIKNNSLEPCKYKDPSKKNYIEIDGLTGPLLVVNRGYGKGKYTFNYCLIDIDKSYQIENHLICIEPNIDMDKEELLDTYNKIIKSFNQSKTKEFVDLYCSNDAMNTTELQYILPIYM